jgi:hypothetical protein
VPTAHRSLQDVGVQQTNRYQKTSAIIIFRTGDDDAGFLQTICGLAEFLMAQLNLPP